ncbi:HAD family phosphatase [Streptomyces sp. TS71-3]|uniref:HAD family hydrolase n=1 Tax=Streptomyces sp. TS71-3 TaxID=2733862 RepID=UPI001B03EA08|nr:HAD family phosphatase [Streptomyces sp. TS71-3]GHJ42223.1 hydrolase [Streptomyces sp. TS71-3]
MTSPGDSARQTTRPTTAATALPAVLFDLDGTLVDSEPLYYKAGLGTLADHGVTGFTWQDHEGYVGISTRETVALWRERYGIAASADVLLEDMERRYLRLARTEARAYPQMRSFVDRLSAAGVPMAVASGSSRAAIEAVLAGTGLTALLPVRVSSDEVARGKPAPDTFLEAARRLGAAPGDCVVVEDAAPGALAARAAGMRCIAVPYVAAQAEDPGFASAQLLFRGGQDEFTAQAAFTWVMQAVRDSRDGCAAGVPPQG